MSGATSKIHLQIGGGPYIRKGQGITARLSGRLNFLAIVCCRDTCSVSVRSEICVVQLRER
jgi:hypothetical protein